MRTLMTMLLVLATGVVAAQKIKYRDLFPQLAGMSPEETKTALKEYMMEDLDHPNANFRLAWIYEHNYRHADPLTQYDYALANADQAKTRWFKAQRVVDSREVDRNVEYYAPLFKSFDAKGKPWVAFEPVAAKMKGGYDSADLFLKNVPAIYKSFTRSVAFYDRAVKVFARFNKDYLTLDDLYLYYNEETEKEMIALKSDYDSARFYFDQYIKLTTAFPIHGHKQKYHVKPIVTYRLDGLMTRMNFLTPDVEFWDYGKWVDEIRKFVGTEITGLRAKLDLAEQHLQESLAKLESGAEGASLYKLDKQLVYNLNNYDKQSLALSLLEYKAFKQDWIQKSKTLRPDTANQDRNAEIYSTLLYENKSADTLLEVVRGRLSPEKTKKHATFIAKHYGGTTGLQTFTQAEHKHIQTTHGYYVGELRSAVVSLAIPPVAAEEKDKLLRFGKYGVSLVPHAMVQETLDKGEPITLQNKKSPDGSVYLIGILKPDKKTGLVATFVAKVAPDGKPGWMQTLQIRIDSTATTPDASTYPGPVVLTQEGCALITHSVSTTGSGALNTFVYLNEKGEDKIRVRMKTSDYPRKMLFLEKSNSFVLLFKGALEQADETQEEMVTLTSVNALGDIQWKREVKLAGDVRDVVPLQEGYLVAGNYASLKDDRGRELKSKSPTETNPFFMKLSDQGVMQSLVPLTGTRPVYILNVVKVSDMSIHLLGIAGNAESAKGKTLSDVTEVMHLMTNRFGQTIATNW